MYQVEAWSAVRAFWLARRRGEGRSPATSGNVVALGVTSLLTDISSEMVATTLPIFLVLHLGLTPLHFGIVEGLYQGMTALFRVASGMAADRLRRCKEIALVGYGLSAVSRFALVFVGPGSWPLVVGSVAADRLGKGMRVVPRDLMIAASSPPSRLATAFGVHRAFDSAGAMLGPLVALALLAAAPSGFDIVFMVSFSVAVCGVAALWFFVDDAHRPTRPAQAPAPVQQPAWRRVVRTPGFVLMAGAATALGLATVSDGFIYLLLQREAGFNPGLLPLLYVGTSFSYLLWAVPAGRVADRIGQRRGLIVGYAALLACYVVTAVFATGWIGPVPGVGTAILLLGAYYAFTDGVLSAAVSSIMPESIRGSGLAWLTTLTSLARSAAAVAFGALWTMRGALVALGVAACFLFVTLVATGIAWERERRRIPEGAE